MALVDTCTYKELTKDQRAAYDELRKTVDSWEHLSDAQKEWLDERCLLRYLRARKFKPAKARDMLVNTLNWRVDSQPHRIPYTAIKEQATHLSNYIHMTDKYGHPICYMRFNRDPAGFSQEDKLQYIMFNLEESIRVMKHNESRFPGVEKLIYMIDLDGFSINAPGADQKIARRWSSILQDHYPERLYRAYLVRYPTIFSVFWSIVSPFMDKVTVEKVKFVNKSDKKLRDYFVSEGFDPAILEKPFGGDLDPLDRINFTEMDDYHHSPMLK